MQGSLTTHWQAAETLTTGFTLPGFDLVRVFHLEKRDTDHHQYDLYLEIGSHDHAEVVALIFENVAKLQLGETGWQSQIGGLQVTSIAERQWEGLRWEVSDYEGNAVRFFCRNVALAAGRREALLPVA